MLSRKTRNGLPSNDPLHYDKTMKLIALILMITLLATVAQTTTAQKLELPPEFFQFGKIIVKGQKALNLIERHCAMPKLKTIPKLLKTQSLGDHPVVKKYFADCKRKLRKRGLETKGTKAIIVLLSKILSFTEAEIDILKEAIAEK